MHALEGLRVVDLSNTPAGALATQLLCDYGADVVHVEPPGGSPLRRQPGYPMWARGKKSAVLDLKRDADAAVVHRLAEVADVVVETFRPSTAERLGLTYERLSAANPRLVHASITGFGRQGPYAEVKGYEGLVMAKVGGFAARARMTPRPGPAYVSVPYCSYSAAQTALHGILAALFDRERTGAGQHVEANLAQGLAAHGPYNWFLRLVTQRYPGAFTPAPPFDEDGVPNRGTFFNLLVGLTADGRWLQFAQNQPRLFRALMEELGLGWMLEDPEWCTAPNFESAAQRSAFWDHMLAAVNKKTLAEWNEVFDRNHDVFAELFRFGTEIFDHPQLVHDGNVVEVDDPVRGRVRQLGAQIGMERTPARDFRAPPELDEHGAVVRSGAGWCPFDAEEAANADHRPPLDGVTVLELGTFFAGPYGGALLADLGARVIKIEPLEGEPLRWMLAFPEAGAVKVMQGKESVALDMSRPEGRAIIHELARRSDLVLQSFRAGVDRRLGIDAETLRGINPDLVYVDTRGYGTGGPCGGRPAFAPSIGAGSGQAMRNAGHSVPARADLTLEEIRTYSVRLSVASNAESAQPDGIAALGAATALLLGLLTRQRTGISQSLVTSMLLSAAYAISDDMVDFEGRGSIPVADDQLLGLSSTYRLYECADGAWVFLAAPQEAEWEALAAAVEEHGDVGGLRADPRFATGEARRENDAALATVLEGAFRSRPAAVWEEFLLARDVGCVEVATDTVEATFMSEQFGGVSGYVVEVDHPTFGQHPRLAPLVRFSRSRTTPRPGTLVGQQTDAVLRELGYDDARIAALRAAGVIGG